MPSAAPGYLLFPVSELREFAARCFRAAGMPAEDAEFVGRLLVRTEARGVETHGVLWIANYCRSLKQGKIQPLPRIAVAADMGSALLVDGGGGLGHLVSARAMELCIRRARETGLCFAGVRNSRHNGAASLYALQAMEAGMIGLSLTGGGVRVAPAGGREALLGTNPIAFAAPTLEEPPFVLDMATSVVAGAKVTGHASKGLPLPIGWALDGDGRPTTDAAAAEKGVLLPLGGSLELGGHKGFALGLVVETLCNVLTGMATGPERARGKAAQAGMGHFVGAIRIEGFQSLETFRRRMDENLRMLRESRPLDGVERVHTPGELEWARERDAEANGVWVLAKTVEALAKLAQELDVPPLGPVGGERSAAAVASAGGPAAAPPAKRPAARTGPAAQAARLCPTCDHPMPAARYGPLELEVCSSCGGVWFDTDELPRLISAGSQVVRRLGEKVQPDVTAPRETHHGPGACPVCRSTLAQIEYAAMPQVRLHACASCDGYWATCFGLYRLAAALEAAGTQARTSVAPPAAPTGSQPAPGGMADCPDCGEPNSDSAAVCWACGSALQGPVVGTCPVCSAGMRSVKHEGTTFSGCEGCGGVWITASRLNSLVLLPDASQKALLRRVNRYHPDRQRARNAHLVCPSCGTSMLYGPLGVITQQSVGSCPKCFSVMLSPAALEDALRGQWRR